MKTLKTIRNGVECYKTNERFRGIADDETLQGVAFEKELKKEFYAGK